MESLPILAILLIMIAAAAPGLYALRRRMVARDAELELWSVLQRRGVSRADAERDPRALGLAVRRCTLCPSTDTCRDWLASQRSGGLDDFCPNAAYLERLDRQ